MVPKVIVFCCNWSTYPGLQFSELACNRKDLEYKILVNMCAGRISPEVIVDTFTNGAWGILVASCNPDECEHDGNYKAKRRIILLKHMLGQLGIDSDRLKLESFDKGAAAAFQKSIDSFMEEIDKMGPVKGLRKTG